MLHALSAPCTAAKKRWEAPRPPCFAFLTATAGGARLMQPARHCLIKCLSGWRVSCCSMFAVCCEQARAFAMFCQARAWHRFTWFACLHPRPAQPAGVREQLAAAVGAEDMLRSAFLATDEASACCFGLVSLCGFWTADATQCATHWLGRGLLALLGPNSRGVGSSMKVDCPFPPLVPFCRPSVLRRAAPPQLC